MSTHAFHCGPEKAYNCRLVIEKKQSSLRRFTGLELCRREIPEAWAAGMEEEGGA